jgi:transcription elongation factor GreA-like protein
MAMSRKDYRAAAAIIKDELDTVSDYSDRYVAQASIVSIAENLAIMFKQDNSRFDRYKFLDAAGVTDVKQANGN